ncbi:MAG TPA: hypothetical protein VIU35_03640 [Chitinophagaceae bacterium]
MKKIILLLCIMSGLLCKSNGQTREVDYNYINDHYTSQTINSSYKIDILTESEFQKSNDVKAFLQFSRFGTVSDGKNRGVAVVYREKRNNNELIKLIVLCIPEEDSDNSINSKALKTINDINDLFVVKYILMGLLKLGVGRN